MYFRACCSTNGLRGTANPLICHLVGLEPPNLSHGITPFTCGRNTHHHAYPLFGLLHALGTQKTAVCNQGIHTKIYHYTPRFQCSSLMERNHNSASSWDGFSTFYITGSRVYFSGPTFTILAENSLDRGVPPLLKYTLTGSVFNQRVIFKYTLSLSHGAGTTSGCSESRKTSLGRVARSGCDMAGWLDVASTHSQSATIRHHLFGLPVTL